MFEEFEVTVRYSKTKKNAQLSETKDLMTFCHFMYFGSCVCYPNDVTSRISKILRIWLIK